MNKTLFTALASAVSIAGVSAAPIPYDRTLYIDFEKSNGSLGAWPRSFAASGKVVTGDAVSGVRAFKISPGGNGGSYYFGYPSHLYSGFRTSVPGVMNVSFNYKSAGEDAVPQMSLAVNFNKKNQGNGSNGAARFSVTKAAGKYTRFFANAVLPEGTANTQVVLGIKGSGSVLIDDLKVAYVADVMTLPRSKYNGRLNLKLSDNFYNPAYKLFGFYSRTVPSQLDTQVQMAADPQGLYVIFINPDDPAKLKADCKDYDSPVWNDDCNELFIFSPEQNIGWQFAVNANGAKADLRLEQRVPGDPFRGNGKWNGSWQAAVVKNSNNWEVRFFIPWKTLNLTGKGKMNLKINLARESKNLGENSAYNCGNFGFSDINGFADLLIDETSMTIKRTRSTKKLSYSVKRSTPLDKIVKAVPKGSIKSNLWGAIYYPTTFGKTIQSKFDRATLDKYQQEMIRSIGESGSAGPSYPWAPKLVKGGIPEMEAYQAKYGKGMLFAMFNSDIGRAARKNGARYLYVNTDHSVDPVDPAYVQAGLDFIERVSKGKDFPRIVKNTAIMRGLDEPTNYVNHAFKRTHNTANLAALDEVDKIVKARYGFGKYGLPEFNGSLSDKEVFSRIAFFRWWRDEYRKSCEKWTRIIRDKFPNAVWHVTNANTVSGQSPLDMSSVDDLGDEVSCDPYPTSTRALYGMERAMYHTGYSVKIVHDLAPNTRTMAILQGFIYHGGAPSVSDMREWASQALKNGAETVDWYISSSLFTMFDEYVGMLNIMRQLNNLEYTVPQEKHPRAGIWYSNYDYWAIGDAPTHSAYSVYSILGEQIKSDFRFVNDTLVIKKRAALDELKVIYVPQMKYTDLETARALTDWVKAGGRLVVFDPDFMSYVIDGTKAAARKELVGLDSEMKKLKLTQRAIKYQNKSLPISIWRNSSEVSADFPVKAYSIVSVPAGAEVIASYPDGKPAAFERKVGRGSVVYFAVQPFGSSDLAINAGAWKDFFKAESKRAGVKTDVPRWDFLLPPAPNVVKLPPLK